MGWLLSVIIEGVLNLWCTIWHIQRKVDDSSVIGQSEFEKEGPGLLWGVVIGAGLLVVAGLFFVLR